MVSLKKAKNLQKERKFRQPTPIKTRSMAMGCYADARHARYKEAGEMVEQHHLNSVQHAARVIIDRVLLR